MKHKLYSLNHFGNEKKGNCYSPPNYLPLLYLNNICQLRYNHGTRHQFSIYVEVTSKALSPFILVKIDYCGYDLKPVTLHHQNNYKKFYYENKNSLGFSLGYF